MLNYKHDNDNMNETTWW